MDYWLQNKEKLDKLLLDEASELILLVDAEKGIILEARGNFRSLRIKSEELQGAEMMILRPTKASSRRVLLFGPSILGRPGYYGEVLVGTSRGRTRTFGIRVQLFEGVDGRKLALLKMQDVTEQIRMAQEMQRMHNELQAAFVELKDSKGKLDEARRAASLSLFAAGLAHEVNNPLAIAISSVSSLPGLAQDVYRLSRAGKNTSEEIQDINEAVQEATTAMTRIGNMIKRIQQLEIPVSFLKFDMATFMKTRLAKNIKISVQSSADLTISSDQQAIGRVLDALVENALLATDNKAPVSILVKSHDDSVLIEVEDTGCGMNDDVRVRACDPFFTTRPPGKGLGLGLFLAKRTMARLGAELSINSTQGQGTKVILSFPRTPNVDESGPISYEGFRTN